MKLICESGPFDWVIITGHKSWLGVENSFANNPAYFEYCVNDANKRPKLFKSGQNYRFSVTLFIRELNKV
jgi:hypothetical protein